jgi:hypothetical protein
MKTIADFSGFVVGDLVTLSDMQTQEEYSKMTVDFPIREVRTYVEPNGVFTYIGYIVETPEKQQLLILVKTMGSDFEIYVFYMDTGAALYQAEAGQDPCALLCLLTADQKDLIKRIEAQITGKNGTHPVTWDLQTVTHGVQYNDTTGVEGICTLGEYFTNDPNDGNSFCMVDWKGDAAKGFLEIWYGCLIKNHEIQLFHK